MKILFIAGMAPITKDPGSSRKLYLDTLGLPLKAMDDYLSVDNFIEFELGDVESVKAAVEEMKAKGQKFVHEARLEPWGQTVARFISPEGLLIGLSYAPWFHQETRNQGLNEQA